MPVQSPCLWHYTSVSEGWIWHLMWMSCTWTHFKYLDGNLCNIKQAALLIKWIGVFWLGQSTLEPYREGCGKAQVFAFKQGKVVFSKVGYFTNIIKETQTQAAISWWECKLTCSAWWKSPRPKTCYSICQHVGTSGEEKWVLWLLRSYFWNRLHST